jgi:hypothetical protein
MPKIAYTYLLCQCPCDLCQRREQFDIESLKLQQGGGVKMPDLLSHTVTAGSFFCV